MLYICLILLSNGRAVWLVGLVRQNGTIVERGLFVLAEVIAAAVIPTASTAVVLDPCAGVI